MSEIYTEIVVKTIIGIGSFIAMGALGYVWKKYKKWLLERKQRISQMTILTESVRNVQEELGQLRRVLNAGRADAWILSGSETVTLMVPSMERGLQPVNQTEFRDINISPFRDVFQSLLKDGIINLKYKKLSPGKIRDCMFKKNLAHATVCKFGDNGQIKGFVVVQWLDECRSVDDQEFIEKTTKYHTETIGMYLTSLDKKSESVNN
jgi:hypothetical protein